MKKTLLTIIITLAVVVGAVLIFHAIYGEGECIFGDDDDKTECSKEEKEGCCDKKHAKKSHGMLCDSFKPIRAEFDTQLSDDEKATIAGIKEKFAEIDHTEMCPEGKEKFMEEYKADFEALTAIADNHKEYFDEMLAKMHEKKKEECKHEEGEKEDHGEAEEGEEHDDDGEVKKKEECPEAHKCKDATEKCKGEKTAEAEEKCTEEELKKCKEAEKKCEQECLNTFKIHFLLLDFDKE